MIVCIVILTLAVTFLGLQVWTLNTNVKTVTTNYDELKKWAYDIQVKLITQEHFKSVDKIEASKAIDVINDIFKSKKDYE